MMRLKQLIGNIRLDANFCCLNDRVRAPIKHIGQQMRKTFVKTSYSRCTLVVLSAVTALSSRLVLALNQCGKSVREGASVG